MNGESNIRQKTESSPKDFFMHLLVTATLYASVVSFIAIMFQYANFLFPDQLNFFRQAALDIIRWATSALIVVFPVYLLLSWSIAKDLSKNPEKRELKIRKWLVYLTLFIAAITIMVDLVRLIYNFYSGDLTTPFAIKVFVVLVVAGAVFGYYLWDLRRKDLVSKKPRLFAQLAAIVVLAGIVAGFFIVGTPAHQRQVRFDERRISDLQTTQGEVVNYWINKEKLPENLDALINTISGFRPPLDPESGMSYEYKILTPLSFELCAVFKTKSADREMVSGSRSVPVKPGYYNPYGSEPAYDQNWSHDAGRVCFERKIDPQIYKRPEPALTR